MIHFITGAPGVGKSTLGDKIGNIPGFEHIDSDKVMLSIEEDIQDYIKLIIDELPSDLIPNSMQEFAERGLKGEFSRYQGVGLMKRTLNQAKINQEKGIKSVISAGLPTSQARKYLLETLRQRSTLAGIINIRSSVEDLISTATERESLATKGKMRYAGVESVIRYYENETLPLYAEGWSRVIRLKRDEIRKEAWEIPELQFFFQE